MALTEVNSLGIKNLEVKTADIAADAVTNAKIGDDQIDSEHYVDGSIDHQHLAGDCIDGDNIGDDVVNSEHIAAGAIDLEHMSSESVDEDNLHISNAGSNGQFLQKSANSGGLTWASVSSTPEGDTILSTTNSNEASTKFLRADGDGTCSWQIPPAATATSGTDNFTVSDGNLIIGTSGHGIDFSATSDTSVTGTTAGAELLDDYEEGQWTPAIKVGGAGNVSISGSQDKGRYVKIGNFVTIWGYFQLSSKGSDNGDGHVAIDGVPYDSDQYGQPDRAAYSNAASQWGNWSNVKTLGVVFGNNSTRCMPQGGDGTSFAYTTYGTNLNNDSFMGFEISYKTS